MAKLGIFDLNRNHREATVDLARLNREMAIEMIILASETGEKKPLIEAVQSLRKADELFQQETTPIENAEIHKKLGDVLLGKVFGKEIGVALGCRRVTRRRPQKLCAGQILPWNQRSTPVTHIDGRRVSKPSLSANSLCHLRFRPVLLHREGRRIHWLKTHIRF